MQTAFCNRLRFSLPYKCFGRDTQYCYDVDFSKVGIIIKTMHGIPTPFREFDTAYKYIRKIENIFNSVIKGNIHFTLLYDEHGVIAIGDKNAINDPENSDWLPLNDRITPKLSPVKYHDLKFKK